MTYYDEKKVRAMALALLNEHPYTISLALALMEDIEAASILREIPEDLQAICLQHLVLLNTIAPEVIWKLKDILPFKVVDPPNEDEKIDIDGPCKVAKILGTMDRASEDRIMVEIKEWDSETAMDIREFRFRFDDLVRLDDDSMQTVIKEIDRDCLLLALKKSTEAVQEKIFSNLKRQSVESFKNDLQSLSKIELSEIENAQSNILNKVRLLEEEDRIKIGPVDEKNF